MTDQEYAEYLVATKTKQLRLKRVVSSWDAFAARNKGRSVLADCLGRIVWCTPDGEYKPVHINPDTDLPILLATEKQDNPNYKAWRVVQPKELVDVACRWFIVMPVEAFAASMTEEARNALNDYVDDSI